MRGGHGRFVLASIGDLHLSERPPLARSGEKDWLAVQAGYLGQVTKILDHYGNPPLVIAGDVFDDGWRPGRCSPALINFAIQHLPVAYAVPGQHDLFCHRYEDIRRSAYWTLVEAGKIVDLPPATGKVSRNGVVLYGFPWGCSVRPIPESFRRDGKLQVAVVHAYVWRDRANAHPEARDEDHVLTLDGRFHGYDAAVIGDNHSSWTATAAGKCHIRNGGTFVRRKTDEVDYKPSVGLLDSEGYWSTHYLDTDDDVIETASKATEAKYADAGELVEALEGMGEVDLDFKDACRRYMDQNATPDGVRGHVTRFLEGV